MSKARIVLPIEGMSCASCAATVQGALGRAAGVVNATVNYATAKAAVDYDDTQTHVAELIHAVRAAGYDCGKASVMFAVEQLHYAPSVTPLRRFGRWTCWGGCSPRWPLGCTRRWPAAQCSTRAGRGSPWRSSPCPWSSGPAASSTRGRGVGSRIARPT